jgi:hypothetical protein
LRAHELRKACESPDSAERADLDEIGELLTDLSFDRYDPAKPLLVEMLNSRNAELRTLALEALGRWRDLGEDARVMDKIREILVGDEDRLARSQAATLFGFSSKWPDSHLRRAMETDPDPNVRVAAFQSILNLRVPWEVGDEETARLRKSKASPTMELIDRIVAAHESK